MGHLPDSFVFKGSKDDAGWKILDSIGYFTKKRGKRGRNYPLRRRITPEKKVLSFTFQVLRLKNN
jgi:hypothetical protein